MKYFVTAFIVFIFAELRATTYYASQAGAGSANGTSLANAWSIAQANTSTNWGSGAGKINPGDTLILNGTLTSQLWVQASGSSGNPITIQFASGAMFSSPIWGYESSAAIVVEGKNYITIDGAGVGVIENTANGDALANKTASTGIFAHGATNLEFKGLTIRNIFVHTYNTDNPVSFSTYTAVCIKALNCSSLLIHNNNFSHSYVGATVSTDYATTISTIRVYANTITSCSTGVVVGCGAGSGDTISDAQVFQNDITMGLNWFDPTNNNHIDGIHCWTANGQITGLKIFRNYIHGDPSAHCTAYVFIEGFCIGVRVYNNLLVGSTTAPGQGYCYIPNANTASFYFDSNTVVGIGSGNGFSPSAYAANSVYARNNIFLNLAVGLYEEKPSSFATTWHNSNNSFYGVTNVGRIGGTSYESLSSWQTITSSETSSITTNPNLDGSYIPQSGSPVIDAGTSLASDFTDDYAGSTRTGTWDIGAYNYGSAIDAPANPRRLSLFISSSL